MYTNLENHLPCRLVGNYHLVFHIPICSFRRTTFLNVMYRAFTVSLESICPRQGWIQLWSSWGTCPSSPLSNLRYLCIYFELYTPTTLNVPPQIHKIFLHTTFLPLLQRNPGYAPAPRRMRSTSSVPQLSSHSRPPLIFTIVERMRVSISRFHFPQ